MHGGGMEHLKHEADGKGMYSQGDECGDDEVYWWLLSVTREIREHSMVGQRCIPGKRVRGITLLAALVCV